DHLTFRIAQRRSAEGCGNHLPTPLALRGLSRALRVTPRSTTSRSAAVNSRVSSGLMKRDSDCSSTSSLRNPSSWDTASLACRILPSRSDTNTGSGALAIMMSACREPCDLVLLLSPAAVTRFVLCPGPLDIFPFRELGGCFKLDRKPRDPPKLPSRGRRAAANYTHT